MSKHTRRSMTYLGAAVAALALGGPLASEGPADFVLTGTQYLDVTTSHVYGVLFDSSTANVRYGGYIENVYIWDKALLEVSKCAPAGRNVLYLYAYNASTVDITGGVVFSVSVRDSSSVKMSSGSLAGGSAYDTSTMHISGGIVSSNLSAYDSGCVEVSGGDISVNGILCAYNTGIVKVSGGTVPKLRGRQSGSVDVSGGSVSTLAARDTSSTDITGGSISSLCAYDNSSVTFHGYDFRAIAGLSLDGNKVLGTGLLTGKWFDGTPWLIPISEHATGATIRVVPEPGVLALLAIGGLALVRRRK